MPLTSGYFHFMELVGGLSCFYFQSLKQYMMEYKSVMKIKFLLFISTLFILFFPPCIQAVDVQPNIEGKNRTHLSLGAILPMTGPYAEYGTKILESLLLAGGFFNAGQENAVELYIEDSQMHPEKARQSVIKLANRDNLLAVIGPLSSEEAFASAEAAGQRGIPLVTLTKNEEVTQGSPYCFNGVPSSRNQLRHLAKYILDELGMTRIAILFPEVPSGRDAAQFFREEIKKKDRKVTHFIAYHGDNTDFSREIASLVGKKLNSDHASSDVKTMNHRIDFDALFIPDTASHVAQIVSQLSFYNIQGFQLLGNSSWNDPGTLMLHRDLFNGAIFVDGYLSYGINKETDAFADHFYMAYTREPDSLDAYAYDAMTLILNNIRHDGVINRERLRQELADIKTYPGVRGSITVNPQRIMDSESFLITVINGERVRITEP